MGYDNDDWYDSIDDIMIWFEMKWYDMMIWFDIDIISNVPHQPRSDICSSQM